LGLSGPHPKKKAISTQQEKKTMARAIQRALLAGSFVVGFGLATLVSADGAGNGASQPSRAAGRVERPLHEGYGQCSISGCPCRAYTGSGWNCDNCGHKYESHW
jgi:hypothetical protein